MVTRRHPLCELTRCPVCFADHEELEQELLSQLFGENEAAKQAWRKHADTLGLYHSWLHRKGIPAEDAFGWATVEAFEDANIRAFAAEHTKDENEGA